MRNSARQPAPPMQRRRREINTVSPIARHAGFPRLVLLSAVALLPAACTTPPAPPTAQEQVFQAKSNYQTLLVDAVKYRQRPACRTIVGVPPRAVVAKTPAATRTAVIKTVKPLTPPAHPVATPVIKEPVAARPVAIQTAGPTLVAGTDPASCANPRVVDLLRSADNAAEAVINNAETTVRDQSTTPTQQNEAVLAAQNSVASFDHVLTQYGVK